MKFGVIECKIDTSKKREQYSDAMKRLTSAGFRMYTYLWNMAELENGHTIFEPCKSDVCAYAGFCSRSYYMAMRDLIDNGFIKLKTGKQRYFLFNGMGD